ncbi:MAG: hypothetical protein KDA32_08245 [Phycisphaerales bacterium]|nr:hypothetical protein [Phycisphaerales bacterium]
MKHRWPIILMMALLALGVRAGWVAYQWPRAGATFEFDDERLHWSLATNLATNGNLVSDDGRFVARMPVYPLFLAQFAGFGDIGVLYARLAQALISAITATIIVAVATTLTGVGGTLTVAALAIFNPYEVFFCNLLLTETLFTLLLVVATVATWRLLALSTSRRKPIGALVAVALCGAMAVMTRPSSAGWVALLWALLILMDANRLRGASRAAICALTLVGMMLPWGLRNKSLVGDYAWLSANGGVTLFDAVGPQADGSSNQSFLKDAPHLAQMTEIQRDRALRAKAMDEIRHDPLRIARLALVKFARTWNPFPNYDAYKAGFAALAGAAFTVIALIAAFLGLIRVSSPDTQRLQRLIWMPILYFTLLHCLFIGSVRYRVPLMPLLALGAVTAIPKLPGPSEVEA